MDDKDWEIFKQQLNRKTGIDLQLYKEQQMRRRINNLIQKTAFKSYTEFFADATRDKQKFADFIEYLTINVSEFFRNADKFGLLESDVIPYLLKNNGTLNIWSAGCSIGAEPYSLAIIMKELTPDKRPRILATDLDIEIIGKAKQGIYTADEIKAMRPDRKVKYFTKTPDGKFAIKPEIKSMVDFRRHNLLKDRFDTNFDLILCRNVVIYFTEEAKDVLYRNFFKALRPGGILFVGGTESILNSRQMGYATYKPFFYQRPLK